MKETALSPPTWSEGTPVQPNEQVAKGPSVGEIPPDSHAQQNEPSAQQNEPPAPSPEYHENLSMTYYT